MLQSRSYTHEHEKNTLKEAKIMLQTSTDNNREHHKLYDYSNNNQ